VSGAVIGLPGHERERGRDRERRREQRDRRERDRHERDRHIGKDGPVPPAPVWMDRLEQFDPARVCFAHDHAVWEP
jgi:hypothetical protein